ncbi:hypothetical protein SCAR479_04925 [Seiridium cardinale]|uniref:O-methyltransferase n=1 Tax=Seiridium cardinale TaxID=138064 RepID=A0ABR2Y582_9PEZI
MANYHDIETCADEIAKTAKTLAQWRHNQQSGTPSRSTLSEVPDRIRLAQSRLASDTTKLQLMLDEPSDLIRRLALHTQLLASLQWLCEFQVLACIPLDISVPFADVAEISGVPESQLRRVARLMATVGFLEEPQLGQIGHSLLSAQFVTQPALLDAAIFLSGTVAPAALKMPEATRQFGASNRPDDSAYAAVLNSKVPVSSIFQLQPKLQRQFSTYLAHGLGDSEAAVLDVLMNMDWLALGNATVVDVGSASATTANKLSIRFPALNLIAQPYNTPGFFESGSFGFAALPAQLGGNVTVQQRSAGSVQPVPDAAVYILRVPSPSPSLAWDRIVSQTVAELRIHLEVLRNNPSARLILTALVLPGAATASYGQDVQARLRDLSLMQLSNGRQREREEVVELVAGVRDGSGGLVPTNEYRSPSSPLVAFEIRYHAQQGSMYIS